MIREVKFESQDRRIKQILAALNENGIASIEEANEICEKAGIDPYKTCEETQNGHMFAVVLLQSRKVAKTLLTLLKQSVSDFNHSVSLVLLLTTVR